MKDPSTRRDMARQQAFQRLIALEVELNAILNTFSELRTTANGHFSAGRWGRRSAAARLLPSCGDATVH